MTLRSPTPLWLGSLLAAAALTTTLALAARDEAGFVRLTPTEIQWTRPNGDLGPEVAILEGDPTKPGLYVQRNRFPAGVFSLPHTHNQDRHVVVLQGTWYAGTGDHFDPKTATPLGPGSYMKHPAGAAHWDGAIDGEVILQITGMGPVSTTTTEPHGDRYIKVGKPTE